jgi:ribosomal protein S12 methylthiotransferase
MPDGKKQSIRLITLGCSKNVVDSEVLLKQLRVNGWDLAGDRENADIAVINTCGFIEDAKRESIDTILQTVELKRQGKFHKVIVMGCLSERYRDALKDEVPEVDVYVGANKIDEVVRSLGSDYRQDLLGERCLTTPSHLAYLKISEGCDRPCSFCSIPNIRGRHVSKPIERVLLEARRLSALGVKELILIAQDSTYYGMDLYRRRELAGLLGRLAEVGGIEWIRLMYAYPSGFPDDVLEQFGNNPKLCRYLDLPVQHISDAVLTSMRRGISSRDLRRLIDRIRTSVPGIALRTTLIVGYPNEGEKEFAELVRFVRDVEFDRLGVFLYSQEDGTGAYGLGDPVPRDVKEERRGTIMAIQQEISLRKNRELMGTRVRVIIDGREGEFAVGRTERDAPEVDNEVLVRDPHGLSSGDFAEVQVADAGAYDLIGTAHSPLLAGMINAQP